MIVISFPGLLVSSAVDDHSNRHYWWDSQTQPNQHELVELCLLQTLKKIEFWKRKTFFQTDSDIRKRNEINIK